MSKHIQAFLNALHKMKIKFQRKKKLIGKFTPFLLQNSLCIWSDGFNKSR